jgi:signal transduction histidine kinase
MGVQHVDDGLPAARSVKHGRATRERAADPSHRLSAAELERLQERAHKAVALEQRQALAADLHETVLQTLFSLQLVAQVALESCESEPARARTALELLLRLLCEARTDMHTALFELRENVLASDGLACALGHFVDLISRQSDLRIRLRLQGDVRLPTAYQESLYRLAREGIMNVVKHARARHASVVLTVDEAGVRLGIDALGGTFRLGNSVQGGAFLDVTLPPPERM